MSVEGANWPIDLWDAWHSSYSSYVEWGSMQSCQWTPLYLYNDMTWYLFLRNAVEITQTYQTAQRQWPWQQKIFTYFACMVRLCVCVKQIHWTTIPRDQDNGKNAFSWEESLRTLGDNNQVHGATSAFVRMNQGREFVFALWFLTCSCHMLPSPLPANRPQSLTLLFLEQQEALQLLSWSDLNCRP